MNSPSQAPRQPPRRRTRRTSRWAVVAGILSVLAGVGLMFFIASLAGSGDIDLNLGDEIFEVGSAERLSNAIARDGPILIPDASPNRTRDIFLQHLEADPERGWLVFAARANGAPRECHLQWDATSEDFVDPCTRDRFPADGKGLTGYIVKVREGKVYVDLRLPETGTTGDGTSTTSPTDSRP